MKVGEYAAKPSLAPQLYSFADRLLPIGVNRLRPGKFIRAGDGGRRTC